MITCPFCGFANEDGALFCEQCKSDLSAVEPAPEAQPVEAPMAAPVMAAPFAEAAPAVPMAAAFEQTMPLASPVGEEIIATPAQAVDDATVPMVAGFAAMPAEPIMALAEAPAAEPMVAEVAPPPAEPVAEAVPPPAEPVAEVAAAVAPPPPPPAAEPVASAAPAAAPGAPGVVPAGASPRLVVLRGQKINFEYPIYEGHNFIGRADEKPVDIDLEDQEPPDRIWSSRQHALITYEESQLFIEDLNSSNGTFVNRTRVYPGTRRQLVANDVIQIGTVQLKVRL